MGDIFPRLYPRQTLLRGAVGGKIELGGTVNLGNSPKFVFIKAVQIRKMPRRSWGPTTKERARLFLEALLKCVNEDAPHSLEILEWEPNEAAKLIAKGQIRHFQELTRFGQQEPLTSDQIKKEVIPSLKELKIYEDKRLKKQGASDWEFSLQLWYKDTPQNITEFEKRWKEVRNQNLKEPLESSNSQGFELEDHLREFCTEFIKQKKQLTTNPLTSKDGVVGNLDDVHVPLALMERKEDPTVKDVRSPEKGSRFYSGRRDNFEVKQESEEGDTGKEYEITQEYEGEEFFRQILNPDNGIDKRFAIIGEPGAGKTTFLVKIADRILETSDIPIWISLAALEARTLEDYLLKIWLKNALKRVQEPTAEQQKSLADLFATGKVWLLLDGADEMAGNPLSAIARQFRVSWIDSAKAVLTCRLNVWEGDRNALSDFKPYLTRNFQYPDRVQEFIDRWFQQPYYQDSQKTDLAESLKIELEQPEKARIRDLVTSPLRLTLLCYTWGRHQGGLPDTQAGLYQNFVKYFYLWKEEDNPKFKTTYEQRERLNLALGELAKNAIDSDRSRFRLFESQVCQFLGKPDSELFRLAIDLGWLNRVGVAEENPDRAVYAFYHPTFQEYFAACAIDDWDYFLPRVHVNFPVEGRKYRIFEPQWKQVILLWLGREDINDSQKEEFIQALVEFEDGCGDFYFYKYQAYFLAAAGITEFNDCSRSSNIVKQVVRWGLGKFEISKERWMADCIQKEAINHIFITIQFQVFMTLREVIENDFSQDHTYSKAIAFLSHIRDNDSQVIETLVNLYEKTDNFFIRDQLIYGLSQIGYRDRQAIEALTHILEIHYKDDIYINNCITLAENLGKVDPRNPQAIAALVGILETYETYDEDTYDEDEDEKPYLYIGPMGTDGIYWQVAEILHKIDPENDRAIEVLFDIVYSFYVELLKTGHAFYKDNILVAEMAYTLWEIIPQESLAIYTLFEVLENTYSDYERMELLAILENIDPNPENLRTIKSFLCELIETTDNEYYRMKLAKTWEIIDPGNNQSISTLIELIETTADSDIRWGSIEILGNTNPGNIQTIEALEKLLKFSNNEFERRKLALSLGKIDPGNFRAISNLVELLESTQYNHLEVIHDLHKIDPKNSKLMTTLNKLLDGDEYKWNWGEISETLGTIDPGNFRAISILINLLKNEKSERNCKFLAVSLGKVGRGYPRVITALLHLCKITRDRWTFSEAAHALKLQLTTIEQFIEVVENLKKYISNTVKKKDFKRKDCYDIIWHCAKNLSYPDFYRAWHWDEATVPPAWEAQFSDRTQHPSILDIDAMILDGETETGAIAATLCELIFEAAFPDEEIPDVENAPQLRKHLKTLKKRLQQPQLAILLRNCEPTSEPIQFCRRLTRVIHIAWITDTPLEPPLQSIPTNHPNPQEAILAGLSEHSN